MRIAKIREMIKQRQADLAYFDSLSAAKQKELTEQGRNPHNTVEERKRKRAAWNLEQRHRFDKLSKEMRDKLTALGLSPYQDPDQIQYRVTGKFNAQ